MNSSSISNSNSNIMDPHPTNVSTTTPLIALGNFFADYSSTNSADMGKATIPPGSPYFGRERVLNVITKDVGGTPDSDDGASDIDDEGDHEKTTFWQTYIHLLKGYIGCGVLSLPWAVSQLGIPVGIAAIFGMAYWSSYNCWTVVKLKRYIERTSPTSNFLPVAPEISTTGDNDDASGVQSTGTTNTNITYPDLGDWAYGREFQSYTAACVCIQQLAICTVFLSFIGENLLAVFERLNVAEVFDSHIVVLTMVLPAVLSLSFLPNLKSLAPVMAAGTVLMLIGFGALGAIGVLEWSDRPAETPGFSLPQAPLAVCAILYSYEGICLVLPVESAMKDPSQFKKVFVWSMTSVALILAAVASLSVLVFGNVTNGSITAFLLDKYRDDPSILWWIMVSNTTVSFSILLTYPLQLFPALELMGPWLSSLSCQICQCCKSKNNTDVLEDSDLVGFEPLPPLPEHDTASLGSHDYGADFDLDAEENADSDDNAENSGDEEEDDLSRTMVSSVTTMFPELTMPGDSPQLRLMLVLLTYSVAVIVPNVQALISLAGAVAGSSTALLIPPVLELAWIRNLKKVSPPNKEESWWSDKFLFDMVKCWILLAFGLVFMLIGTVASISDIISIYM